MRIQEKFQGNSRFSNFELLAQSIVEGYMTGIHKSPFHGFSAEFAEHKIYNNGDSTKHIDWKLFAKTDKLYTKRYEEETNMRCHIILDQSASMHYPSVNQNPGLEFNKIEFSALASAVLLHILKKQRDAAGLSLYDQIHSFYASEKASERHYRMLVNTLEKATLSTSQNATTKTYEVLHQIAEQLQRRSMIFLFTDLFQSDIEASKLFEALRHLKYNKHELVLFHIYDKTTEFSFDFENTPKRFVDIETGNHLDLFPKTFQKKYTAAVDSYFEALRLKCAQYKINYVDVDIRQGFDKVMMTYFEKRHKFL